MYRALCRRDARYEGVFWAGVTTTGVFCRPTCRARKPLAGNVRFYASASEALHDGFRPCRICHPLEQARRQPPVVERLLRAVDADPAARLRDEDLVRLGIDPSNARRAFRRATGLTFQAYARARRLGLALRQVKAGAPVIDAQLDGGYDSGSGFRDAFAKLFGKPPANARETACLLARRIETPLGTMLALADEAGLRLLEFLDRRTLEREIALLRKRLRATVVPGHSDVLDATAAAVGRYFAGERESFDLPLAPVGSAFELAVWKAIRALPTGTTCTYGELAAVVGRPGAARAVGRATGMNAIALAIPCHRVVGAGGALTGYSGGLWRKQRLLEHERRIGLRTEKLKTEN